MEQQHSKADAVHQEAVWVMVALTGLLLAPFLPASNLLFYVGTFIGERLLYLPSAGFCLLLSHFTIKYLDPSELPMWCRMMQWLDLYTKLEQPFLDMQQGIGAATVQEVVLQQRTLTAPNQDAKELQQGKLLQQPVGRHEQQHKAQEPASNQLHQQQQQHLQQQQQVQYEAKQRPVRLRSWLGLSLICLVLAGYSWRTVSRNWDWQDEETLFIAAQKVTLTSVTAMMPISFPC